MVDRSTSTVVATLVTALVLAACAADEPESSEEAADPPPVLVEPDPEPDPPPTPDDDPEPPPVDEDVLEVVGVAAGHPDAVDAGIAILDQGGTAVDAAVAAAFASGVSEPFTSGIGGGGAALVHEHGGDTRSYDYREVVAADGRIPATNTGVPGFVAGMAQLHADHGDLPFADVLAPAIALAEDGTAVSGLVAERLAGDAGALPVGQLPHLFPGGAPLGAGDVMVQEDLADTMRTLADDGPEAFYDGPIATTLADRVDGLDAGSLADYEVQTSAAPGGRVGDLTVFGPAPPLAGTSLVQQLQIAEGMGVADVALDSADFVHALAAARRVAIAHQSRDLGDPGFVDVPVDDLTDRDRNRAIADGLDLGSVPSADVEAYRDAAAPNTTHITVVDRDGTMVSMTNTITNFWGSRQYEAGFFLNDHLSRFALGSGQANQPEAGKRPVTWSLPTIVVDDDGQAVLGIGSPGGARIPDVLATAIVRWMFHDRSLEEVVAAPRFHVDGAAIDIEAGLAGAAGELTTRGWGPVNQPPSRLYFGSIQALEVDHDTGEVRGANDTRREADHRVTAPPDR